MSGLGFRVSGLGLYGIERGPKAFCWPVPDPVVDPTKPTNIRRAGPLSPNPAPQRLIPSLKIIGTKPYKPYKPHKSHKPYKPYEPYKPLKTLTSPISPISPIKTLLSLEAL